MGEAMLMGPPKGTFLHQTASYEPSCMFLQRPIRPGRVPRKPEKKTKTIKESQDAMFHACAQAYYHILSLHTLTHS